MSGPLHFRFQMPFRSKKLSCLHAIFPPKSKLVKLNSFIHLLLLLSVTSLLHQACTKQDTSYSISGQVVDNFGTGMPDIKIYANYMEATTSTSDGYWSIEGLAGTQLIGAYDAAFDFSPDVIEVKQATDQLLFVASPHTDSTDLLILNWFKQQQLPNGLLESTENGNLVSLYDNALAALVFLRFGEQERAEKIFDFFNNRISSELQKGPGGFSQFRDRNGSPNNHRWMGDNAWLLIALNNYKKLTGNDTYEALAAAITNWLTGLQDSDGGLFAGFAADDSRLNYKVTEGNIDAFNAVRGYSNFHSSLLQFLHNHRWDSSTGVLEAWPENPPYRLALDNFSWGYAVFEHFPTSTIGAADRFKTIQTSSLTGKQITGYCFDEDKDVVWFEGSAQMAVAFKIAGMQAEANQILDQLELGLVASTQHAGSAGFPYAANGGTGYAADPLWTGADTQIAISGGAWYLFAKSDFNPFGVERNKMIPAEEQFWNSSH